MTDTTPAPIRSAVIGYGGAFNMGRGHANWMNEAGMQTIAACDIDPTRMLAAQQDFPGIRTYTDMADLLRDEDVDLCVVILPHNAHAEAAIRCADAGKHVIVEKPMCLTVAEADAMIEAAKRNNVMLSVFHNRRHDGDFLAIKETIERGVIGDVFHVEAYGGGYGHPGTWWRANKAISGGAMYDWGAHFMDWILNLIPAKMLSVDGYFQKRVWHDVTNEDHSHAVVRFDNDAVAELTISSLSRAPKPRWRILGTKGAIVDEGRDPFTVFVEHEGYPATVHVPYKKTNWQAYYANIVAHLRDGAELDVKPEQARRTIAVFEAAEQSSKEKRTVTPAYP
ncbi:MAG: Gfo/Idh/MocA family oxidoreductase [Chthonomonadales bacterium]|nr:Gfo/Idh/MocA family oxidoreductase [Chthonomonadales bacterium]